MAIDDTPQAASPETSEEASPATSHLLHRFIGGPTLPTAHSAQGSTVILSDGRKILDACGGAAVSILGHAHPEVLVAATTQLMQLSYVHTGAYTTSAAETLANTILDGNSHGLTKALFVSSGSEAMDAAMKLSCQYFFERGESKRTRFISRKQGYHGVTIGAMGVSSNLPRKVPYKALQVPNVSWVTPAYYYQYAWKGESQNEFVERLKAGLIAEFERFEEGAVIAFVGETVVGATTGCVTAPKGYWRMVREVCDMYGALLILDEVMCGMGRTGSLFAFEQEGIVPDIVTIGKGLGGGYAPIAGLLISQRIVDGLMGGTKSFNHFQTYQAHPLSCGIAAKVQEIVKRDKLVKRCKDMGQLLEPILRESLEGRKYVGNIRGRGSFWGIEFVQDKKTKEPFDPTVEIGVRIQKKAFELGVAIYPGVATVDGTKGDHVLLAPPYTMSEMDLKTAVDVTRKAYDAIEAEIDQPDG